MQSIYVILFPTTFESSSGPALFLYGNQLFARPDAVRATPGLFPAPFRFRTAALPQPSLGFQSPSYLPYAFAPNRDAIHASTRFFYSALYERPSKPLYRKS